MSPGSLVRPLCLVLLFGAACGKKQAPAELPLMAQLEIYNYHPHARLEERIGPMPAKLLELYRLIDARPDYRSYTPSPAEKALFLEYLRLMPPAVERIFRQKCVGLYFVEGFTGNGMTSWVADEQGNVYFHMTLNPAAFRQTLSETLSERERSCFITERGWKISVDAGTKYKGLAYAVFHEAAHAADYMEGISPLVDTSFPERYRPAGRPDGGLFTGAWASYSKPFPRNEFFGRGNLTFYGFDRGPKIPFLDAGGVYQGLAGSPFISLYGSKSWAEDLAELTAYGLITGKLGQPYKILISGPGGVKMVAEPMKGAAAKRAAAALALLEKL